MPEVRREVRHEEHVALVRKVRSRDALRSERAAGLETVQEICEDGEGMWTR